MLIEVDCPHCGSQHRNIDEFESMLVLGQGVAMLWYTCPCCHQRLVILSGLPAALRTQADEALRFLGADDGRRTWPSVLEPWLLLLSLRPPEDSPLVAGAADRRSVELIERFRYELEHTKDVDDAIRKAKGPLPHDE